MTARELDVHAARLRRLARVAHVGLGTAGACVAGALAAVAAGLFAAAAALGVGALTAAVVGVGAADRRRGRVAWLARDRSAYAIPEARAFGLRWCSAPQRRRLAAWLRKSTADARMPRTLYLAGRVSDNRHDLLEIADELEACVPVDPSSVIACLDLLKRPVESPLFNPTIPADEVANTLRRIRQGIHEL